jgi:HicB-like antitoxin of HicAB toxin-antitoxin system
MRYAIVIEKAETNYSAYAPDLPGCVATGDSVADIQQSIRDAVELPVMRSSFTSRACARIAFRCLRRRSRSIT